MAILIGDVSCPVETMCFIRSDSELERMMAWFKQWANGKHPVLVRDQAKVDAILAWDRDPEGVFPMWTLA